MHHGWGAAATCPHTPSVVAGFGLELLGILRQGTGSGHSVCNHLCCS